MTLMFLNGGAMRGGPLHHLLAGARFVGVARTAPRYRFFSVGDRFPALAEITGPSAVSVGDTAAKSAAGTDDADPSAATGPAASANTGPEANGVSVTGELYDVPWEVLRESLLPAEPAELELGVIELEDGSGCLSMVRRRSYREPAGLYRDISEHADWRSYTAKPAAVGPAKE